MATFTVTVNDAALAVKLRGKDDITADQHVQDIIDAAFAAYEQTARVEAHAALIARYDAADASAQQSIDTVLAKVNLITVDPAVLE